MGAEMTRERAEEFGAAWNSGNADLVTSFFADDGAYHASVGLDHLGKSYFGTENIRRGVQAFFDRFPNGKFENLKVVALGHGRRGGARCRSSHVRNAPLGNI
jgi:SnoaL-like domain